MQFLEELLKISLEGCLKNALLEFSGEIPGGISDKSAEVISEKKPCGIFVSIFLEKHFEKNQEISS